MKNTSFKVEDIFDVIIKKDFVSQKQIIIVNQFLAKMIVNNFFSIKINIFKPKKKEIY